MTEITNDFGFRFIDADDFKIDQPMPIVDQPPTQVIVENQEILAGIQTLANSFITLEERVIDKLDGLELADAEVIEITDAEAEKQIIKMKHREVILTNALIDLKELSISLLSGLMSDLDKEYILWPNRGPVLQARIEQVESITKGLV